MQFDRKKFFDGFKREFDNTLDQSQVDGINFLLDQFEADPLWNKVWKISYGFATTFHETAGSMQPVEEAYYLEQKYSRALMIKTQKGFRYYPYFGRGYPQTTWLTNYKRADKELRKQRPVLVANFEAETGQKFDLINKPEQMKHPLIAFATMTLGMSQGWFTGKKLTDFAPTDYYEMRTIINGHDKATLIAAHARRFEKILTNSLISAGAASVSETVETTNDTPSTTANGLTASPDDQTGLSDISTQPPITQNAENIVNVGDNAPLPSTENVDMQAPAKDGATASSTKMVVFGIAVPGFVVAGIKTIQEWIAQGYISASEVGATVLNFIKDNQKYVFILIGLIILLQIVKKIIKAATFLFSMLTAAIPHWNTVNVVPAEAEPVKPWWKIW